MFQQSCQQIFWVYCIIPVYCNLLSDTGSYFCAATKMHQFSSLLSFYTALVESDLPEVEKWSACIGINAHFSNGKITCFCYFNLNFGVILLFSVLLL